MDDLREAAGRAARDLQAARDAAARETAETERRLAAARADADAADARAAQLSAQVSDLASALAALGPGRPPAPRAAESG
jgi:hypothetical protein